MDVEKSAGLDRVSLSSSLDERATRYILTAQQTEELEGIIPQLLNMEYWGPVFQAWEPLVREYMTVGVDPESAENWLIDVVEKQRVMRPHPTYWSKFVKEMSDMSKSQKGIYLEGYCWEDILSFVSEAKEYIDNYRKLLRVITNSAEFERSIMHLLSKHDGINFSWMVDAVYLYRHRQCDLPTVVRDVIRDSLRVPIKEYVHIYQAMFYHVMRFLGDKKDSYYWYRDHVCERVINAWNTCIDPEEDRVLIRYEDVTGLPPGLSIALSRYITSLPCVDTTTLRADVIWDAITWNFAPDKVGGVAGSSSSEKLQKLEEERKWHSEWYLFCIPKNYLKNFIKLLSWFVTVVENNTLSQILLAQCYNSNVLSDRDAMPAVNEMKESLISRGFPVEE